jgi:hypothetical protein
MPLILTISTSRFELFALLVLILMSPSTSNSVLILPNGQNFSIVELKYAGTPPGNYIFGPLVPASPVANYSGKIVFVDNHSPMEPTWRDIKTRGGVAGITSATKYVTPGFTEFWTDGSNTSDITIYTGELGYFDWVSVNATLWQSSNIDVSTGLPSMNVIIDGWAPNPWNILLSRGFLAWQIILVGVHVAALAYTVYKMVTILLYVEPTRRAMALTVCILESIGLLIRIVYLSMDPLGAFRDMPYQVVQIFITISLPFGLASNLLILFTWQEILSQSIKVAPFLTRLLVPFLIVVTIVFLLDLAGGISRAFGLSAVYNILLAVNTTFYAVIILALTVWIFVIAGRVFKYMKWSQRTVSKTNKRLLRTTLLMTLSGCVYVLLLAVIVLVFIQPLFATPIWYVLIWFFIYFLFTLRGFLQVLSLNVPKKESEVSITANTKEKTSTKGESSSHVDQEGTFTTEEKTLNTQTQAEDRITKTKTNEKSLQKLPTSKNSDKNENDFGIDHLNDNISPESNEAEKTAEPSAENMKY